MKLEEVVLLTEEENKGIWERINSSSPSELINISMGVDEKSITGNIDEFIKRFRTDRFAGSESFSELLMGEDFSKKDLIVSSFRKYRFIIFDSFKEDYEKFKGKQEYFTIGALVDDVKTSNLDFRICILIDYIYSQDTYALTTIFGFEGIYLNKLTKELIDLYESSIFPCLKLWELIISGNKEIDSFLEERKFLSEKIPYRYSSKGEISSYSVSIEELYELMDKEENQ